MAGLSFPESILGCLDVLGALYGLPMENLFLGQVHFSGEVAFFYKKNIFLPINLIHFCMKNLEKKPISIADRIAAIEAKIEDNLIVMKEREAENILLEIKKSRLIKKKEKPSQMRIRTN